MSHSGLEIVSNEEEWKEALSSSLQCKGAESAGIGPLLPPPFLRSWKIAVPSSHILISTQTCGAIDD